MLTVEDIRKDFPILSREVNGKPYAYLDNTATTQKPVSVIQGMAEFLTLENATVHRGIYHLSQRATERCDDARRQVQGLINAVREEEIIFTKGTTESINLVAATFALTFKKGDEIGYFNFGSTVICLFPNNKVTLLPPSNTIQMGNVLAKIRPEIIPDTLQ